MFQGNWNIIIIIADGRSIHKNTDILEIIKKKMLYDIK